MVAVTDRVEVGEEPAFEQADLLVDAGQDTAGHQQLAYVGGRPPGLQEQPTEGVFPGERDKPWEAVLSCGVDVVGPRAMVAMLIRTHCSMSDSPD